MALTREPPPILQRLVGVRLVDVERGVHVWFFRFADGSTLSVECVWRIRSGGQTCLTSEDDGQRFGLPAPVDSADVAQRLLCGKAPQAVQAEPGTGDLRLSFPDGIVLEVLSDSTGYEAWQLRDAGGAWLVVARAGQFEESPRSWGAGHGPRTSP